MLGLVGGGGGGGGRRVQQQQIFEHYKYLQDYDQVSLTIKEHWILLDLGQIISHNVEIAS
jgi:hypothetical protein